MEQPTPVIGKLVLRVLQCSVFVRGREIRESLGLYATNVGKGCKVYTAESGDFNGNQKVRELRNELGYQILTHKDRSDLKPGQYLLETDKRLPAFARNISKETKARVLERTATPVKCAASALVIATLTIQPARFNSRWVISSTNLRAVMIRSIIFELFARIVMKDYRTRLQ